MKDKHHLPTRRAFLRDSGALLLCGAVSPAAVWNAANVAPSNPFGRTAFVGSDGVMRWTDDNIEVALFGVNYCIPSASAYRMLKAVGADPFKAIDVDILHLRRLGLDAVRLCFWGDWENSDAKGNLVDNDHLELLDHLIARAKEAGMYMLLSPIITYDASWPDAMDRPRSGISSAFKKEVLGLDQEAISAQVRYLQQILQHRNRFTEIHYKDEPAIVAVEPINEPWHHPEQRGASIDYINALAAAVRSTGCKKPIFYNVTERMAIADAVRESVVDGATFAWYPTGLVSGHTLTGNFLPLVDEYPQMRDSRLAKKAKLVYEFDAPDLLYSYMYPAMARTFRTGGIQFATMFTYDSLPIAAGNLEFQTHYLNLVYTPHKALSLMIAAEAFRRIPRGKDFGSFPHNKSFQEFRVDDVADLSEMVSEDKFLYSNNTTSTPADPSHLKCVAGCGSSPSVQYEGSGAYFLDQLAPGNWRLEVYPDSAFIDDPFVKQRIGRDAAVAFWRERKMTVSLPDLGASFVAEKFGNASERVQAESGTINIRPGIYLLHRDGLTAQSSASGAFTAPKEERRPISVRHVPPPGLISGQRWECPATVVASEEPRAVDLYVRSPTFGKWNQFPMTFRRAAEYACEVPADVLSPGLIEYCVTVTTSTGTRTYPQDVPTIPTSWDFPTSGFWSSVCQEGSSAISLFDSTRDRERLLFAGDAWKRISWVGGRTPSQIALRLEPPAESQAETCCQWSITDRAAQIRSRAEFERLAVDARCLNQPCSCTVLLIERDGSAWGAQITLQEVWALTAIPLNSLKLQKAALIPRGFPYDVTSYWRPTPRGRGGAVDRANPRSLQFVQLTLRNDAVARNSTVELQSIEII